ncbi:hypothetical protein ACUZIT_001592 [Enterobacter hormaechei]|jgi:hypothetical protein|uniref:Uncharacterized protein n=1 Tax=Enterobacter bugandensis TaxID=881260 RepID=A0AA42PWE8_9ENTR|nr:MULTISPECIES: hypothetical protein [Enterobacter]MDH1321190.1 hypothetical protein [Enterobacter bugandensis]
MKVCLGVIDMPYDYGDTSATTYEVAEDLQDRYQLFTHFFETHKKEICAEVGEALAWSLINHIQHGAPLTQGELLGETMQQFNIFLEQEEMAGLSIDGVPTQAALEGKNSRLKIERGERRPSFIDGGLFKSSFVAWIGNDAES